MGTFCSAAGVVEAVPEAQDVEVAVGADLVGLVAASNAVVAAGAEGH